VGESEAGEHQHECDFDDGEAGGGWTITSSHIDVVGRFRSDAATFQKYAERRKRVPGVEGAEREDIDDGEAGVGRASRFRFRLVSARSEVRA